jgi:hypothetical protein
MAALVRLQGGSILPGHSSIVLALHAFMHSLNEYLNIISHAAGVHRVLNASEMLPRNSAVTASIDSKKFAISKQAGLAHDVRLEF